MPKTIKEGETGEATDAIVYPEITSCLTITYCYQGHLYGGHAVAVPTSSQKTVNQIVDYVRPKIQNGGTLLLLGVLDIWEGKQLEEISKGRYSSFAALVKDLEGTHTLQTKKYNTGDEGSTKITVKSDCSYSIS